MSGFLQSIKQAGMRKMLWALIALMVIGALCVIGKLDGPVFRECFIALVGFVMGANYGEHNAKSKEVANAVPVAPAGQ